MNIAEGFPVFPQRLLLLIEYPFQNAVLPRFVLKSPRLFLVWYPFQIRVFWAPPSPLMSPIPFPLNGESGRGHVYPRDPSVEFFLLSKKELRSSLYPPYFPPPLSFKRRIGPEPVFQKGPLYSTPFLQKKGLRRSLYPPHVPHPFLLKSESGGGHLNPGDPSVEIPPCEEGPPEFLLSPVFPSSPCL